MNDEIEKAIQYFENELQAAGVHFPVNVGVQAKRNTLERLASERSKPQAAEETNEAATKKSKFNKIDWTKSN